MRIVNSNPRKEAILDSLDIWHHIGNLDKVVVWSNSYPLDAELFHLIQLQLVSGFVPSQAGEQQVVMTHNGRLPDTFSGQLSVDRSRSVPIAADHQRLFRTRPIIGIRDWRKALKEVFQSRDIVFLGKVPFLMSTEKSAISMIQLAVVHVYEDRRLTHVPSISLFKTT